MTSSLRIWTDRQGAYRVSMKNIDYLVTEKPAKALIRFAIPMIIGNLFQQAYTIVDSAIVGRYVGETALAAVGASYALTAIFICIAIGGGIGASVIISQHFGERRYGVMKTAIFTAMTAFLAISLLLGGVGLCFSRQIMEALNTPADAMEIAVVYLNIYFYGLPFLFMYNIVSSLFNALGESRIPLYFLIFSSVLNVALDLYLVAVRDMGVAGAAYATFFAQGISAVLSFLVFLRTLRQFLEKAEHYFSREEFMAMSRIALPSILQQSTVSIGMMLVQSVVNGFGTQILAGFSAAMRIESLCIVPMAAIGNAVSSYTAQNIGADKKERVTEGYLRFIGFFFCLIGFKMAVDSLLRGAGDVKAFTIANLVNLSIRVLLSKYAAPVWGVAMVWYAVPIGWLANFVISFCHYKTGKWKKRRDAQPSC